MPIIGNRWIPKKSQILMEMANVGNYSFKHDQFEVWVYVEPLMNPSFHFRNVTEKYEVVLQMKDLKILEWKTKKVKIPIQHLRRLVQWFKERSEDEASITNWQALILAWNQNNPRNKISNTMPNFETFLSEENLMIEKKWISESDILMEMANAIQKYTGLPGVVYFSTKEETKNKQAHALGRVKYIKAEFEVSCSIKEGRNGRIKKYDKSNNETIRMIKALEKFIELNEEVLWDYWNTPMILADSHNTMKLFKKVI